MYFYGSTVGAVFAVYKYTDSSSSVAIARMVGMPDGRGTVQNINWQSSVISQQLGFDGYTITNVISGSSNWPTNIRTPVACDIYKNGTKLGTTTPDTAFSIGVNLLGGVQAAIVVAIPV